MYMTTLFSIFLGFCLPLVNILLYMVGHLKATVMDWPEKSCGFYSAHDRLWANIFTLTTTVLSIPLSKQPIWTQEQYNSNFITYILNSTLKRENAMIKRNKFFKILSQGRKDVLTLEVWSTEFNPWNTLKVTGVNVPYKVPLTSIWEPWQMFSTK